MADKRFVKSTAVILGIAGLLMLLTYVLVKHHRGTPDRVQQQRSTLLGAGSSVAERTQAVGQVSIASAGTRMQPVAVATSAPAKVNGQNVYQSACIACHGAGIAGAPKLGDSGQWAKRVAKGVDTLYTSAIKGMQGSAGVMPPKGGNLALSNAEVKAAVDYIVAQSK